MKKEFKKCGSGDNVCNCNSADECGYSIPYENTTKKSLDECLEQTAQRHGYADWLQIDMTEDSECEKNEVKSRLTMEAAKLFESQFVKKDEQPDGYLLNGVFKTVDQFRGMTISAGDNVQSVYFNPVNKNSVSSDVEQALANISHYVAGENVDPKFNELTISVVEYNEAISAIRKWQSTQRQTVNSDVEQFFKYFPNHGDESGRNEWTVVYGEDDDEVIITAEDTEEDAQEVCRRLNKILFEQSTQQPATINFFSDEEIRKMFGDGKDKEAGLFCEAMVAACHTIQSKLKERVNCVDEDKTKCSNEGCQLPASCGGKCGAHCDCLA